MIASFAFNFNNFNNIYLLDRRAARTRATPSIAGDDRHPDQLHVQARDRDRQGQDYGLASAFAIIIFFIVASISACRFCAPRTGEHADERRLERRRPSSAPRVPTRRAQRRRAARGSGRRSATRGGATSSGSPRARSRSSRSSTSSRRRSARERRCSATTLSRPTSRSSNFTRPAHEQRGRRTHGATPDSPFPRWFLNTVIIAGDDRAPDRRCSARSPRTPSAASASRAGGSGCCSLLLIQMFPQFARRRRDLPDRPTTSAASSRSLGLNTAARR